MTLIIKLAPSIEKYVLHKSQEAGVSAEEYVARVLVEYASRSEQQDRLVAVLDSWIEKGDAREQTETGEYLVSVLDEDRSSFRKLFPPELKGISW